MSGPSALLHTEFVEAVLLLELHLTSLPALAELRLDSLCEGEAGGWGWSRACEEHTLGSSINSTGTHFSLSLLLLFSVLPVSFFLFD